MAGKQVHAAEVEAAGADAAVAAAMKAYPGATCISSPTAPAVPIGVPGAADGGIGSPVPEDDVAAALAALSGAPVGTAPATPATAYATVPVAVPDVDRRPPAALPPAPPAPKAVPKAPPIGAGSLRLASYRGFDADAVLADWDAMRSRMPALAALVPHVRTDGDMSYLDVGPMPGPDAMSLCAEAAEADLGCGLGPLQPALGVREFLEESLPIAVRPRTACPVRRQGSACRAAWFEDEGGSALMALVRADLESRPGQIP